MSAPARTDTATGPPPRPLPAVTQGPLARLPPSAQDGLATGLSVLAVRRPAVPLVEVRLRVPAAGTASVPLGPATLLAETLLTGTARRSQVELAADLQALGGALGTSVDADRLSIGGSALAEHLGELLDLVAEILTGASYPEREVTGERTRLADRLAVARSQPGRRAREALLGRLYGAHPYARELPEVDEVTDATAEQVRALHADRVRPDGAVLVLVGDLDPDAALQTVSERLGGWAGTGVAPPGVPAPLPSPALPALVVDRPGSVQTTIRLGGPAPQRWDPGYAAAKLANLVFGGYFSSRLVANIRERRGYTYSPRSAIDHGAAASLLTVAADVRTEVTAPAMVEIGYELGLIATLPVPAEELDAARRYAVGALALSTATQAGLASTLAALAPVGLGLPFLAEHPRDLLAATIEEVAVAARGLLAPAGLSAVLLGDASAVAGDVAAVTPVELA